MKPTHKTVGLSLAAVAALMLGTAAIADKMGDMPMSDMMGGHDGMMGGMMGAGNFDLSAVDTDKDGKISKDEMTAYRTSSVAAVDTNADGKLSVDEIAAMHLKAMEAASKAMAERMVAAMDSDGDGLLTAAELIARPIPAGIFDRIDTNADGFLDQAEIDAAKARMMDRGHMDGGRGGHRGHHMMDGGPDGNGLGGT